MVLMATIGLAALGVVIMNAKKQAGNSAQRNSADRDIERIMARVASLIVSPADCNANFLGKKFTAPYSTLPSATVALYKCSVGGTCNGSGSAQAALNFNNWVVFPGELSGRVRISNLTYALTAPQSTSSVGPRPRAGFANAQPAVITLSITFQRDVATVGGNKVVTTSQPYTINAFVITSTTTYSSGGVPLDTITDNPTGLIYGCATSPSSIYQYPTHP